MNQAFTPALGLICALASPAWASGHGPVFGYSTPVNSQREWSLDSGLFARHGSRGTQFSTGTQLGYGLTPHLTLDAFLPAVFGSGALPETRVFPSGEWTVGASWRFLHSVTQVGKRLEATGSLAAILPGPQPDSGPLAQLNRAPGVAGTLAAGFDSRSQYLWLGGGYTGFTPKVQTRRPDTISWSAVYAYRPARLRRGYDQWDYRGLAELTGEHTGNLRPPVLNSSTTTLWLGPSLLAIHKNIAIEGASRVLSSATPSPRSTAASASASPLTSPISTSPPSPTKGFPQAMKLFPLLLLAAALPARAEYKQVNMTVFGMDCAPCAHAIHVSMKGIQGVDKVDVDLNTGLVSIALTPGNAASLRQFNQAVEKNGFTHKDAKITADGLLSGTPEAPVLTIAADRYTLLPAPALNPLLGKPVAVTGTLPQAPRGKLPLTLQIASIREAQ